MRSATISQRVVEDRVDEMLHGDSAVTFQAFEPPQRLFTDRPPAANV